METSELMRNDSEEVKPENTPPWYVTVSFQNYIQI